MDYIFSIATRMMLEQDVISKQVEDAKYLQSLDICLQCDIGRDYLFRFLQQSMIILFLCTLFVSFQINIRQYI